jgi:hypothetical protein
MLARLRPLLQVRAEAYAKWYIGGAFNGAGYDCNGGAASVVFYGQAGPKNVRSGSQLFRVSCGSLLVDVPWSFDLGAAAALLASCEQELAAQLSTWPGLLEQVTRFQVWLIYRSTLETCEDDRARLAAAIVAATGGAPLFAFSPHPFLSDGGEWNGDLEVVLPAAIPEATLRARLATFFTGLGDQALFGFGAMCPNHEGTNCPDTALRYAHITARQF